MSNFSFSFIGDDIDIEDANSTETISHASSSHAAETGTLSPKPSSSAFPIPGQTLLPPQSHSLEYLLATLPSKIAYSTLSVKLDDGSELKIPRRELWDVRVQLMAEGDDEGLGDVAGKDDVRTGVYEGGFKSWESAVDLVRVLYSRHATQSERRRKKIIELGCGTALPSLAIFQWLLQGPSGDGLDLVLADYNPSVLSLVTLPNLLLSWAQVTSPSKFEEEGELDLDTTTIASFRQTLTTHQTTLSFFSGAWSPEFITLLTIQLSTPDSSLTIVGAETIYSPAALKAFAETLLGLLDGLPDGNKSALVAAKLVYFGVGGSMEDFCQLVRRSGWGVERVREESKGVRRATVEVTGLAP